MPLSQGIDVNKLNRNYTLNPLDKKELPTSQDLEYLLCVLNLPARVVAEYFQRHIKWVYRLQKKYNIYKTQEQKTMCYENSFLQKYGVCNPSKLSQTKQKISNSWNNRTEQEQQEILHKRSVTWANRNVEQKQHKTDQLKQSWTQEKRQQMSSTMLDICSQKTAEEKQLTANKIKQIWEQRTTEQKQQIKQKQQYAWVNKSEEEKQQIKQKFMCKLENTLQKSYNTKKLNNTFNTSKPEQIIHKLLQDKFNIVYTQYKCEEYPFMCDFYIPQQDLFLEINFHWTHGGCAFENTENCRQQLQHWHQKQGKFYENAINTWTIRDVQKRNFARNNKLNWIEFFNWNEFNNWYSNLQGDLR